VIFPDRFLTASTWSSPRAPAWKMIEVPLGRTGLTVSRLAFGTGTDGWAGRSRQTRLGLPGLADLMVYACERGVTFLDTADEYGSHPHVREALKRIPRERVVIATKTTARDAKTMRSDLDRFRRELGLDVIDVILMHCPTDAKWNVVLEPVMGVLSGAKRAGIVRALGVSPHSWGALNTASSEPWVDAVLVRINYAGVNMDNGPDKVIPVMRRIQAAGKGVYAMKAFGAGRLSDARRSISFVMAAPVDALTVGMETRAQVDENIRLVSEFRPVRQDPPGGEAGRA